MAKGCLLLQAVVPAVAGVGHGEVRHVAALTLTLLWPCTDVIACKAILLSSRLPAVSQPDGLAGSRPRAVSC